MVLLLIVWVRAYNLYTKLHLIIQLRMMLVIHLLLMDTLLYLMSILQDPVEIEVYGCQVLQLLGLATVFSHFTWLAILRLVFCIALNKY